MDVNRRARAWLLVGLALLVVAGCGSTAAQPAAAPGHPNHPAREVDIATYDFSPTRVTVRAGTTVTWVNHDAIAHTVTSGVRSYGDFGFVKSLDLDGKFDFHLTGSGRPTAAARWTFSRPGTYHVLCTIHPGIDGVVKVVR